MFSSAANSRLRAWLPPALVLWAAVGLSRPMEIRLLPGPARPAVGLAAGGGNLALLGGMRSVLAGGCWLRANLAWERRDAAATMALVHLTVAADERPLTFWLNGARMLAFDLAEWRTPRDAPAAVRRRIAVEQAAVALAFLERGLEVRGADAAIYVEMANLHLRALGDREKAAEMFRLAAQQPGAPCYAARIHAELLRELGRPAEALAWLRQVLPSLPEDDPAAQRNVVLARIKGLEQDVARK